MKNTSITNRFIAFIGSAVVAFLLFMVYFTWTYGPIETYSFPGMTAKELEKKITDYIQTQPNLSYEYLDSIGSNKYDIAYRMKIRVKSGVTSIEYTIMYEEVESLWKKSPYCELSLGSAYSEAHKIGGYQKSDNRVEKLLDEFEVTFIRPIKDSSPKP